MTLMLNKTGNARLLALISGQHGWWLVWDSLK